MLGNADAHTAVPLPVRDGHAARSDARDLLRALRCAGVEPRVRETPAGIIAGGAAMAVSVTASLDDPDGDAWRRIVALIRARVPVTLALRELGAADSAIGALEAFAATLRDRLAAEGCTAEGVGLSIRSHVLPLEAYRLLGAALLGPGARYVILDGLQMRPPPQVRALRAAAENWRFLWRCRDTRCPLLPAYAAGVTTRCALLGDEAAGAILPELGLQVPADSAWLPLVIRLPAFADDRGRIDGERLWAALHAAVELGEALLDALAWPEPGLARDAADNRRLAVELRGLGDLVARRGLDPSDLGALRWLEELVARAHAELWSRSRALAREHGALPSLVRSEPEIGWSCDRSRSNWQERWRQALAGTAVRHRNLLVLSPYAVLPDGSRHAADCLDLLPVLAHADAYAFGHPPRGCFGGVQEFARFHSRAWAVMQRRHADSLVAAGV